jgi:hypothetical protein
VETKKLIVRAAAVALLSLPAVARAEDPGNIIVEKQTNPDGSAQSFEFDPSWSSTNFFLTDGTTNDSGELPPTSQAGTYSVTEVNLPTGWSLSSVTCDDGSDPSAIDLASGETVTCTFNNTIARGNIIVEKQTHPDGSAQSFEFDPSWSSTNFFLTDGTTKDSGTLLPTSQAGTYSVTEVNLPPDWSLSSVTCDDGSPPSAIYLDAGETITCTFVNRFGGCIDRRVDTCDPKLEETFTYGGQCWQAKCEGKVDTPLEFVLSACLGDASLSLSAEGNSTSCQTLQLAEDIADINSIKTECNGADGVQKIQVKAVDKYPANGMADVGCLSDDECCGEAICDSGVCALPYGAPCYDGSECLNSNCVSLSGVCEDK